MSDSSHELLTYARLVLKAESDAILDTEKLLDESFEHAVNLIAGLANHGHVITSGIGKAGFVAMKCSATLASIGIPSFFLHPAEAVHGDIGRFTKSDLTLIFSNSGETPEILSMLPGIKRIGCPVITITAESQSSLGKHSDVVIATGRCVEVGPLGLAPTTSTTVMLAVGDALSMTILKMKGITQEQYAQNHPGGAIGKSLLLVKDIMRVNDEICLVPETLSCKEVLHRITLTKNRPGAALITNDAGTLCGIFTDGDLRRCLDNEKNFLEKPVSQFMGTHT